MNQGPAALTRRGILAATAASYTRILGAADAIRAALVGCGSRGARALLPDALRDERCLFVAACDVYKPNLDRALSAMYSRAPDAAGYTDYRRVIDRKDVDVVFVATPDHWHGPITVAACEAGKDVYVEKPLANSFEDCLAVVDAAARTRRIVQVGVQQRSMKIYFMALEMIQSGAIGSPQRCTMVWGADGRGKRPSEPESAPPEGLDWEMFQGNAPRRPYRPSRQRSWRSYWEYGSGAITDFGVHLLDVTQWFQDVHSPRVVFGAGYHSPARSPEQVPDIVALTWQYRRFLGTYQSHPDTWGNTFRGDAGALHVNRGLIRLQVFGGETKELKNPVPGDQGQGHVLNFLDCVRTRRKPNADAGTGCRATIPCLLAALSVRTGKSCRWDETSRSPKEV